MKIFCVSVFYVAAFVFTYAGVQAAPDMTWPSNDAEYFAALLILIGCASKLMGHAMLFSFSSK